MTKRRQRAIQAAAIVYTVFIATVSLLPSGSDAPMGWDREIIPPVQKTGHSIAYALFVVVLTAAWSTTHRTGVATVAVIALLCIIFGAAMECAQAYIPGRTAAAYDEVLNTAGVTMGCLALAAWRRYRARRAAGAISGPSNPPPTSQQE